MLRAFAAALALILVLGMFANHQQNTPVVVHCGVTTGGVAMTETGTKVGRAVGEWMRRWATADAPTGPDVKVYIEQVAKRVLLNWAKSFIFGAHGKDDDAELLRLHDAAAAQEQQARDMCTPCPTAVQQPPSVPQDQLGLTPADKLSASVSGTSGTFTPSGSPEEVARQAAARYWPASEVDTAVAVAQAESGLDPTVQNASQHSGLWQVNRDAIKGRNWRDPVVNAYLAYGIWKEIGWSRGWTTYSSGAYKKYLRSGSLAGTGGTSGTAPTGDAQAALLALAKSNGAPVTPHTDPQGEPADDIMSSGALNSKIAEEVRANHAAYNVRYVISQDRIASANSKPAWSWRTYSPITSSGDFHHTGHVHVSYTPGPVTADARPVEVSGPAPGVGCQAGSMVAGLRVATWNSFHGRLYPDNRHGNDQRVVKGMLKIAAQADIVATQELSDHGRKDAVTKAMDGVGFKAVGLDTSHPFYYRDEILDLVADDSTPYYHRGDSIEGPDQGDRDIGVGQLLAPATGQTVTEINLHQLPHIQSHGELNPDEPKRSAVALKGWTLMAQAAKQHMAAGAVVVTGDMNYDGDPENIYRNAGLTMVSQVLGGQDTLRKREIDQVLYSAGVPLSQTLLGKMGSDHEARLVTFAGSATEGGGDLSAGATLGTAPTDFAFPGQSTPAQALAWMASHKGEGGWSGRCLAAVGRSYGQASTTPVNGHYYATGQWDAMPARYKHQDGSTPPPGALVFWDTSNVAGHIALSAGGGKVWTTDAPGSGSIGLVDIAKIDGWGTRLGWSAPFFIGRTRDGAAA